MRLIHCPDMRLEEFLGDDIPTYAILSHTWGKDEVGYKDFGTPEARSMAGWYKIRKACGTALFHGIKYVWVDACCIDKSSSAELSEAINSMFQWYADSEICYAVLEDCDGDLDAERLANCRWMSRGWTLQELIAPQTVVFFNRYWQRLRSRRELSRELNRITGISKEILDRDCVDIDDLLQLVPVCQKMSWASKRKTTRVEDTAYCLMGLFGVNMPLLYGEGPKAFIRLQEEIIKHSNDMTVFAWRALPETVANQYQPEDKMKRRRKVAMRDARGALANSPFEFGDAGFLKPAVTAFSKSYTITNKGIRFSSVKLRPQPNSSDFWMDLDCYDARFGELFRGIKGIIIRHIGGVVFMRVSPNELFDTGEGQSFGEPITTSLYLATSVTAATMASLETIQHDAIRVPKTVGDSFHLQQIAPPLQVQGGSDSDLFITRGFPETVGYATYRYEQEVRGKQQGCDFLVFFGSERSGKHWPWCYVATPNNFPRFNHKWLAWEENIKHYGSDSRLGLWIRSECKLTIEDQKGNSATLFIHGHMKKVHQIWQLILEVKSTK